MRSNRARIVVREPDWTESGLHTLSRAAGDDGIASEGFEDEFEEWFQGGGGRLGDLILVLWNGQSF